MQSEKKKLQAEALTSQAVREILKILNKGNRAELAIEQGQIAVIEIRRSCVYKPCKVG
jgi:hypothetical protein